MEAIVVSAAAVAVKYTIGSIKDHIGHAFNYRRRVERLEELLDRLMATREAVRNNVEVAARNGEEILYDAQHWLDIADQEIEEVKLLTEKEAERVKKKCFIGLCPNIKFRYRLGKTADEKAMVIKELLHIGKFENLSLRPPLAVMEIAPLKHYEALGSRSVVLNDVMQALKDDKIRVIGVYGMAGVGKTVLVKEVARLAMELHLFDSIVMAVVTHTPDIRIIQNEIAEMLGLRIEEKSLEARAFRLCRRLNKGKNLVILDDIWSKLDLRAVGIPIGEEHVGCKILLTSRSLELLRMMDARENLEVNVLTEKESWVLFKQMAGDRVESPEFRSTAMEIAKRCAGLPISIITVARNLRNKGLFEWMDALMQLNRTTDMHASVQLSYDFLRSEESKQTFLLCSLLGHHVTIQDLLKCSMGLGLLFGVNTVEETRNRLLTVVNELKASSLLCDSYTNDRFDMRDLIYDVAVSIASRHKNVLVLKPEDDFAVLQDEEKMRKLQMISLQYATVLKLPDELKCPQLSFFYMGNKNPSLEMPPSFFKEMKNLKVLTLTKMHFSSLPSSIGLLIELRTLCLDQCVLGNIAIIGELKNLETLSLQRSDVEALPSETGQLLKLKLLDLGGCTQIKVIPSNVFSRLFRLEELYLGDSFVEWRTGGDDKQRSYASLAEFRTLVHLSVLDVHIRDDLLMPKDLFLTELERYKVFIGDVWDWSGRFEHSRVLKLKLNTSIALYPGVKKLLKNTEDLYLDELKGVKNVLGELNDNGFPHLKNLHVQKNMEILYVVNSMERPSLKAFPILESLILHNLINLEKLCRGQLGSGSFKQLRIIKVRCCDRLMNLLPFSVVKGLHQLLEIEVTDCKSMMQLFFQETAVEISEIEATTPVEFSHLRFLTIGRLPMLTSFCSDETSEQGKIQLRSGVRSMTISLFDEKVVFRKLEYLKLCALNMQMIWPDELPQMTSLVEKLTTLDVEGCNNLKYLFSSRVVKGLVQLKNLKISGCKSLEEVIFTGESRNMTLMLPELVSLSLHDIPNLKRFCFRNYVEFPNLKELWIKNCPLLDVFIPSSVIGSTSNERVEGNNSRENAYTDKPALFDDQVAFPKLEKLIIIDLQSTKRIWNSKFKTNSFNELRYLEVGLCKELKNIFPIEMLERLQTLSQLRICNCDSLEEIVEPHEVNAGQSDVGISTQEIIEETATYNAFKHVAYLQLYMLRKLKSFYPKFRTAKWPSLEKIQVSGCNEVHIFASEMSVQNPLFSVDKGTFPRLQELWLERNAVMKEICHGQLRADQYFPRLEVLKLIGLPKESTVLSSYFFQSISNIPKLIVSDASCSGIFQSERLASKAWKLNEISELSLSKLPELTHLWIEPQLVFQNLKILKILGCGKLESLAPSSAVLQNLRTLEVSKCHKVINLITPLTAKSMVQLMEMSVTDCKLIEEIIAREGNEVMDEWPFPKLKYLRLQHLPSLTSLYWRNSTFHPPSSCEPSVVECPKLKNFSKGESRAEMLESVHPTEEDSATKDMHMKKSQDPLQQLGFLRWELRKLWEPLV